MSDTSGKGFRTAGFFNQGYKAADEDQQYDDAGVVAVQKLRHDVVTHHGFNRGDRIAC